MPKNKQGEIPVDTRYKAPKEKDNSFDLAAFTRGANKAYTYGYAPELEALAGKQSAAELRRQEQELAAESPWSTTAGELYGSLTQPINYFGGGLARLLGGKFATPVAQGMNRALGTTAVQATGGAAHGYSQNKDWDEAVKGAAISSLFNLGGESFGVLLKNQGPQVVKMVTDKLTPKRPGPTRAEIKAEMRAKRDALLKQVDKEGQIVVDSETARVKARAAFNRSLDRAEADLKDKNLAIDNAATDKQWLKAVSDYEKSVEHHVGRTEKARREMAVRESPRPREGVSYLDAIDAHQVAELELALTKQTGEQYTQAVNKALLAGEKPPTIEEFRTLTGREPTDPYAAQVHARDITTQAERNESKIQSQLSAAKTRREELQAELQALHDQERALLGHLPAPKNIGPNTMTPIIQERLYGKPPTVDIQGRGDGRFIHDTIEGGRVRAGSTYSDMEGQGGQAEYRANLLATHPLSENLTGFDSPHISNTESNRQADLGYPARDTKIGRYTARTAENLGYDVPEQVYVPNEEGRLSIRSEVRRPQPLPPQPLPVNRYALEIENILRGATGAANYFGTEEIIDNRPPLRRAADDFKSRWQ